MEEDLYMKLNIIELELLDGGKTIFICADYIMTYQDIPAFHGLPEGLEIQMSTGFLYRIKGNTKIFNEFLVSFYK